ncbi:hypothetical protein PITC_096420 [Penicillium italicum]|uniref:Uncharacterized protein n=1 Tax=Penicillium italicum TaxID=40296 RepID=A0A0A2KQK5_PENIT|nr:hypothetical protein PITC_096420 [Penicillium italicum]
MCHYRVRVHNCGHYDKTLKTACGPAKRAKKACTPGSHEDASTSGSAWRGISGCNKKSNLRREGPGGKFFIDCVTMD